MNSFRIKNVYRRLLPMLLLLWVSTFMYAQGNLVTVKGKVIDAASEEVLIGVTVKEVGGSHGAVTDLDGNYSLQVKPGAMVEFSYISYKAKSYKANAIPDVVKMEENTESIAEVVVVGYGSQKKVNLSGSVSAIEGSKLAAQPATDAVSALQGQMPGVTVMRNSGQPGSEASGMRIRGFSSVNSTSALVLVDGVEGDLALVNADDIASISVLKDAAACAIYGARAAAGVVLVTTKSGTEGKAKVTYNGYFAFNTPGNMPERLPAWEEMKMNNEARINAGGNYDKNPEFSSWIGNPNFSYRPNNNNSRWDFFQSTNWVAEGTRDYTTQQNHTVSISGGTKAVNYMLSAKWYTKNGILKYGPDSNERWSLNAKVNAQINKYVSVGTLIRYQSTRTAAPQRGQGGVLNLLYSARGWQPIYNPEEDINDSPYNGDLQQNAIDIMKNEGANRSKYEAYTGKVNFKVENLVKGFTLNASLSRLAGIWNQSIVRRHLIWYNRLGTGIRQQSNNPNSYYRCKNTDYHDLAEMTANYHLNIAKKHDITVLGGMSYENYRKDQMDGTVKNLLSNDFFSFNYYDSSVATNTGIGDNISTWSMMSYFGRLNYAFADKYLFEANVRYDGSSRLAPDKRWKAFPSVSAAWRVNQENFMKNFTWMSNLKLRASWGQLGNGAVLGLYDYIPTISQGDYMGQKTFYQGSLASKDKTWETISTTNIGVDMGFLNNRLNATFDYYWKYNDDMLASLQLPHTIGIGVPNVNIGKLKTWGWDFEISWKDQIKDFSYQLTFNLSDSQNKLVSYDGASVVREGNVGLLEGYEMNTIWGYKTDGYWKNREEYLAYKEAHPGYQSFNDGKVAGGDVRYLNQGEINHQVGTGKGTKEDHGDLVYLGNSNARYLYGFNLSAQWKGFDLSMMFQGVGKRNILIAADAIAPFKNTYQMPWTIHRDYWTEGNQDAYWPRLFVSNDFNYKPSDKWVQDASYLRLKNITLGYTIPSIRKYVNSVRVYVTGNDLWELTNLLKVFDPEAGNNVGRNYYPFFRTWAFGVNVTF